MSVFIIPPLNLHNLCKKSLGRSLAANSSRSRSSRKFVRRASCVHRRHTDSQTARQVDRQTHKHMEIWLIGVELPSRCVVLGSWSIYFFGCCLVNSCGGLIRWILWHSGSPGKEHHARLVQGLSNWQVWAASPLATVCCIWSSGCRFGSCIPVSSLQYQLIGKLLGSGTHPIGELSQNWSC